MGTGRQRISTAARLKAKAGEGPVLELEHVLVQEELEHAPVAAERELAQAAAVLEHVPAVEELELVQVVAEPKHVQVVVVPEHGRVAAPVPNLRRGQLEARRRTRSATEAHHRGRVPLLAAVEDLAAVAETTRDPAATEAATVWAAAARAVAAAPE